MYVYSTPGQRSLSLSSALARGKPQQVLRRRARYHMICHMLLIQHIFCFVGVSRQAFSDQISVDLAMASGGLQTFVNKVKSHAREFADSLTPVLKVNDLRMN